MGPATSALHPAPLAGALLLVVAVAVVVGVIVHITGESGVPADDHLPALLVALLGAVIAAGGALALLLPRPPQGS